MTYELPEVEARNRGVAGCQGGGVGFHAALTELASMSPVLLRLLMLVLALKQNLRMPGSRVLASPLSHYVPLRMACPGFPRGSHVRRPPWETLVSGQG